jgi:hypothetical protein
MRRICLLLLAILCSVGIGACPSDDTEKPTNILLITIDTLRADHLGTWGYPRDTSRSDPLVEPSTIWMHGAGVDDPRGVRTACNRDCQNVNINSNLRES